MKIIKTFKAAVLYKLKKLPTIKDITFKDNLEKGQVLVKISSASICGAQMNEIEGVKGPDKYLPHMMGHEGYGKIIKTGKNIGRVKVGDYVVLHWRKADGHNVNGACYNSDTGIVNSGQVVTFAQYAIVSENRVTKVNLNKKLKRVAPLFGCCLTTAYGLVFNEAKILKKHKILIVGSGGLGLSIAGVIKTLGVEDITFVDKKFTSYKKKFIEGLNIKKKIVNIKKFKKNLKNLKFDQIIETTGSVKNISYCFDLLSNIGTLVLVGQPNKDSKLIINNPLKLLTGARIISSDGGHINPGKDLNAVISMVSKNYGIFNNLISHTFNLVDINKGIILMKNNKSLRVVVKCH